MRKLFLLLACTSLTVGGIFAQNSNEAKNLFDSGKAKFTNYDASQVKMQMKQPVDTTEMCSNLMEGYVELTKALPLDTIMEKEKDGTQKIDKKTGKPKFKTKYSKDIVGLIDGHKNDFLIVGQLFYERQQYKNAAEAWTVAVNLSEGKAGVSDTIVGQYYYYIGIANYFDKNYESAMNAFSKATQKKFADKNLKSLYQGSLQLTVANYLEKKDYAKTNAILDKAIAEYPTDGLIMMLKGVTVETETDNIENAVKYYEKAVEFDPSLAMAQYHMGRYYNNKAVNLMNADENKNLNDAQLAKIINPICAKAKPYLDKAVELDETNSDAKRLLNWVNDRLAK